MNAILDIKLDQAAFLRWVQRQEGRYELQEGRVVMQAGTTRQHALVCSRFVDTIRASMVSTDWNVFVADFAVGVGDNIRYPDVLVEPVGGAGDELVAQAPALVIEVLSPSSVGTDMTEKPIEYGTLPTLHAYIVASQDEPIAWLWLRQADGTFPQLPLEVAGRDAAVDVPALGLSLPLEPVYAGIGRS